MTTQQVEKSTTRLCARCRERPAAEHETGLRSSPVARSPYCDLCEPIVEEEEREADRRRRAEMLLSRAGAEGAMRNWSLATFPDDEHIAEARRVATEWLERYLAGDHVNLLLYGPTGTGKSGLAWSLIREACEHGHPALFLIFRNYLWDLRQSFNDPLVEVDQRGHTVGLLALDDLGAERPTPFARDELATLVEHRHTRGWPTIVTSNYDPDELARRLGHDERVVGERIVSRLVQGAVQHRFTGPDRRLG